MRRKIVITGFAVFVLAFGLTLLYGVLFFDLVRVPVGSMANTIIPGDHLVIKNRDYGEVVRGDLIIFKYENDATIYLGRVVGLPKETIHIRDKIILINNHVLDEERVTVAGSDLVDLEPMQESSTEGRGPYRVFYVARDENGLDPDTWPHGDYGVAEPFLIPENNYFVLGDNRDNSEDSRYRGTVPGGLIFGKPKMIYWSSKTDTAGDENVKWERMFMRIR